MLLMSVVAFAQNQIKGHVADATGEPIIGANVTVKGTTTGTITDIDGNFTLEVGSTDGTLVVSFIGYKSVEAKMNGTAPINVVLQEDTETLDEVVVVGYGTQNRKSLTGAISDVKSESLTRSVSTTTAGALTGKIAGISTRAKDARPGKGINLEIRNMGTPLFVIDGIPYGGNTSNDWLVNSEVSGNDVFNALNIEDIESITVLKDASAAIYGLRASNGVVLVTTKKGKKLRVLYTTQVKTAPPTFILFVNNEDLIQESYKRYLENKMREAFGFTGTPIRLSFRERKEKQQ